MKNLDLRVGEKYRLVRKIGGGSFGVVYLGTHTDTGEEVAIKLEHASVDPSFLREEIRLYEALEGVGIPRVRWHGFECEYRVMVFDLLGPSLEDLFNFCRRKFSLKTVLMIADQLISRFEYIHSKQIIHRDIKPDNFLMGIGSQGNQIYITDFGLSLEYQAVQVDPEHKFLREPSLIGTARYASVYGHYGVQQSRRDDMESLGYVIMYFLRGFLPWQGFKAANKKEKRRLILEKKKTMDVKELCDGLPNEFVHYFDHVRSLAFNDKPDYTYLRENFHTLFIRESFEYDNVFDWTVLKFLIKLQEEKALKEKEEGLKEDKTAAKEEEEEISGPGVQGSEEKESSSEEKGKASREAEKGEKALKHSIELPFRPRMKPSSA